MMMRYRWRVIGEILLFETSNSVGKKKTWWRGSQEAVMVGGRMQLFVVCWWQPLPSPSTLVDGPI